MLPELWTNVLDLLFPPRCAACGQHGTWFCQPCRTACQPLTPAENANEHISLGPTALSSSVGVFRFSSPLREAILALKYKRHSVLVEPLVDLMLHAGQCPLPAVDAIIPVPLYARRQRERGFNQAELLARQVADYLDLPLLNKGLRRIRATKHQPGLGRAERRHNVAAAFQWQGPPPPRRVLLFDDVVTTGATLEACALALHAVGTTEIHGWALARDGI